jgi:hypothetical protein
MKRYWANRLLAAVPVTPEYGSIALPPLSLGMSRGKSRLSVLVASAAGCAACTQFGPATCRLLLNAGSPIFTTHCYARFNLKNRLCEKWPQK